MTRSGIGHFMRVKYQKLAQKNGYYKTAQNLRRQGVPLEVTRAILLGGKS